MLSFITLQLSQLRQTLIQSVQTSPHPILNHLFYALQLVLSLVQGWGKGCESCLEVEKAGLLFQCHYLFYFRVFAEIQLLQFEDIFLCLLGHCLQTCLKMFVLTDLKLLLDLRSVMEGRGKGSTILGYKFPHRILTLLSFAMIQLKQQPGIPQFPRVVSLIQTLGCLFIIVHNLNYQSIVIIQMDGLTCQYCKRYTNEFTILRCDHVVCTECLWAEVKSSLEGMNTIKCMCGIVTQFSSKSGIHSGNITVATSPRRQPSRNIRTQAATLSVRTPSSPKRSRLMTRDDRQVSELQCEVEFLAIQFRKSLEEVERNFRRVVENIKIKYENLVKNIKMFWFQQVLQSKSLAILELPKLLMRKYNKSVGTIIRRLNDAMLEQLTSFHLQTLPSPPDRTSSTCKHHYTHIPNKQNTMMSNTCLQQRKRQFYAIQQLKQGRGIKKIGRKARPAFQKM